MTALETEADHLSPVVKTGFGMMGADATTVIGASELMIIGDEEAAIRMENALVAAKDLAEVWYS